MLLRADAEPAGRRLRKCRRIEEIVQYFCAVGVGRHLVDALVGHAVERVVAAAQDRHRGP
jgi:hypothetical protein